MSLFYKISLSIASLFLCMIFGIGLLIFRRYGDPFPKLFYEFDKKMWMTVGLGSIFFGFYLLSITLFSWVVNTQQMQTIFAFIYTHTVESVYLALFIFGFTTTSIYLARLLIKYLYSSRRKKDL